ncbi:MAG: hypothetical protein KGK17_08245 [Betaproteobacteria bacterium]|nr:hypothetical protein [Betaproteobacteria bacterium]
MKSLLIMFLHCRYIAQKGQALPRLRALPRKTPCRWIHPEPQPAKHRILRLLIERVQLREDGLNIIWRDDGWHQFRRELEQHPFVAEQRDSTATVDITTSGNARGLERQD